eukprot:CAMPEP_0170183548 /NCGR_PEP_ID=MMETSP0040_2-20121228/31071_1 /TAXON_ID=641309 /ORGANISM="Lotharella oceanica, Strain CCMP622" /LENGTH=54 /DNA_ID=CAMNT_0010429325 /DNA_START=58 /DNA_END=222 /DNA_ORIENTATION=+
MDFMARVALGVKEAGARAERPHSTGQLGGIFARDDKHIVSRGARQDGDELKETI